MIVIGADATGACEKFPSHVPCAFVTIPMGEIVAIFSPSGDGTFKTGATLDLKICDEHTWHAVDALRRDMIKKWFDVDEAVFLPPRTITVLVPSYTTIYDTSDAGEGTCSLSCTTGDTPLHVGDRIGLYATLRSFGRHTVCYDSFHSLVFECEGITAVVNELITNSGSRRSAWKGGRSTLLFIFLYTCKHVYVYVNVFNNPQFLFYFKT